MPPCKVLQHGGGRAEEGSGGLSLSGWPICFLGTDISVSRQVGSTVGTGLLGVLLWTGDFLWRRILSVALLQIKTLGCGFESMVDCQDILDLVKQTYFSYS